MHSDTSDRFLKSLQRHTGSTYYDRGASYARGGRVREWKETVTKKGIIISGTIRGREMYETDLGVRQDGELEFSACSCPMFNACKHVAALGIVWNEERAKHHERKQIGSLAQWEEPFARIAYAEDTQHSAQSEELQLLFDVQKEANRGGGQQQYTLGMRPAIFSLSTGNRSFGNVSWRDVSYQDSYHRFPARQWQYLHLLSLALFGGYAYRATGWHPVRGDEAEALWPLLRHHEEYGVKLLFGKKETVPLSIADTPLTHVLCVRDHAKGLDTRMEWRFGDQIVPDDAPILCGMPPVFAMLMPNGGHPMLCPVRAPSTPLLRQPTTIPASGIKRFSQHYLPQIIGRGTTIENLSKSVTVPVRGTPTLAVHLRSDAPLSVSLNASFIYGDQNVPLYSSAESIVTSAGPMLPDRPTEQALLQRIGDHLRDVPTAWTHAVPRALKEETIVTHMDAVRFVQSILPALQADADISVVIDGELPSFEDLEGDPTITMNIEEGSTSDWFDLALTVRMEDVDVPIALLIEALARNEDRLLLPDGHIVSLAHPELQKLKALLEEARGMAEVTATGVRLSKFQAGFFEELQALGIVRKQAKEWKKSIDGLLHLERMTQAALPPEIATIVRPYQADGVQWLRFLADHNLGGILADDMGLGKTLQAIGMLLSLHGKRRTAKSLPSIVVAPTSVVESWDRELRRFAPRLHTVFLRSGNRTAQLKAIGKADLVVTSYALLTRDFAALEKQKFRSVIFDEAQYLKNHQAKTYGLARRLRAECRFALTGTPMENSTMELWSVSSIVAPGLFGDPAWFRQHYQLPIEREQSSDTLARLRRRIRPFLLRRTKERVEKDLPPKMEQVVMLELPPAQRKIYDLHLQRERQKILGLLDEGGMQKHRFAIFRSLMRLRQLCLHPELADPAHHACPSAKLDALREHLATIASEDHRVLVFSQFTSFLRHVRFTLDKEQLPYLYLDGRTKKRKELVETFQDERGPRIFLISLKAGGVGLTLTAADYCILLDPWWNPAVERQAVDRTHRIGQTKRVFVYRFIAKNTIEEKVLALQQRKQKLFTNVLDDADTFGSLVTEEDIRTLLETGLP